MFCGVRLLQTSVCKVPGVSGTAAGNILVQSLSIASEAVSKETRDGPGQS